MRVRTRVRVDLAGVNKRVARMTELGQYALANQVHADSNIYAPMLSSDLRNQSYVTRDNKQVVWNVPYARKQYYNQFSNYTTPGTGPWWDRKAMSIHFDTWLRITEKTMRKDTK